MPGAASMPEEQTNDVSAAIGKSIRRYIEKHLSEPLSPQELAATYRISRSQIYRIFEPDGGVTRYVWERRMQRSLRMLSQPIFNNYAIGTIAFECGFSSESHFSRSFKSRFGRSPSHVRAESFGVQIDHKTLFNSSDDETAHFANWIHELSKTAP